MSNEPVPVFGSWKGWYVLLIGVLALLVLLFHLLTRHYA